MKLEEAENESEKLDFTSPASIFAFTKKVFGMLRKCDEEEMCERDEDKRSSVYRDKIFQRFALLFYYSHYLATCATTAADSQTQCSQLLETMSVARASIEQTHKEQRSIFEGEIQKLRNQVTDFERRQM